MLKKLTSSLLSIALLFICSCDSSSPIGDEIRIFDHADDSSADISGLGVDPDFQLTVDRFVIEANKRNISVDLSGLDIQYGNLTNAAGVCITRANGSREIIIASDLRSASDDFVSEIVIHELGHCVLGRDHSSNPESIMHATNIIGQPWRVEVLDELFSF